MSKLLISLSARAPKAPTETAAELNKQRNALLSNLKEVEKKILDLQDLDDKNAAPKRGYYLITQKDWVLPPKPGSVKNIKNSYTKIYLYVQKIEGKSIKGYDAAKNSRSMTINSWKQLTKVVPITKEEFEKVAESLVFKMPKLVVTREAARHNLGFKFEAGNRVTNRLSKTLAEAYASLDGRFSNYIFAKNTETGEVVEIARVSETNPPKLVWKSQAIRKAFTGN